MIDFIECLLTVYGIILCAFFTGLLFSKFKDIKFRYTSFILLSFSTLYIPFSRGILVKKCILKDCKNCICHHCPNNSINSKDYD